MLNDLLHYLLVAAGAVLGLWLGLMLLLAAIGLASRLSAARRWAVAAAVALGVAAVLAIALHWRRAQALAPPTAAIRAAEAPAPPPR